MDAAANSSGRRERVLGGGAAVLVETLASKVLHGWLQNRHQTLFPLTVNVRTLDPAAAAALARVLAVAVLADDGDAGGAEEWFAGVGADAAALAAYDRALAAPPALSEVIGDVSAAGIAAYAYVAGLMAIDARRVAGARFLEYLAARLALPATVVRSADRRYRR